MQNCLESCKNKKFELSHRKQAKTNGSAFEIGFNPMKRLNCSGIWANVSCSKVNGENVSKPALDGRLGVQ